MWKQKQRTRGSLPPPAAKHAAETLELILAFYSVTVLCHCFYHRITAVPPVGDGNSLLASGAADGIIRLWNSELLVQLSVCTVQSYRPSREQHHCLQFALQVSKLAIVCYQLPMVCQLISCSITNSAEPFLGTDVCWSTASQQ